MSSLLHILELFDDLSISHDTVIYLIVIRFGLNVLYHHEHDKDLE